MINPISFRYWFSAILLSACLWLLPIADVYAVTLKQAMNQVARQYNGKVVSAMTVNHNGRRVHVIRVVTKAGVVKTVQIPE